MEEKRDKNNAPQKERKSTAKTIMNLVTSCLMILAKVFVYNPVVLQIQENIDQKKRAYVVSLNAFNFNQKSCKCEVQNERMGRKYCSLT